MELLSELIHRDVFLIENGFHPRNVVLIVLDGKFCCSINGEQFIASANDVCIFYKEMHFTRSVLQPLTCLFFQMDSFPVSVPAGLLIPSDPVRSENSIRHLIAAVQHQDKLREEHYLRDLLLLHGQAHTPPVMPDEIISGCIAYLHRHYSRHITLDELAQEVSMSRQGLIRKFRRHTGTTPLEYLSRLRISESKRLLKDTALPIGEIALQCGFENVYYFSNCFKRSTGISPSGYRKLVAL